MAAASRLPWLAARLLQHPPLLAAQQLPAAGASAAAAAPSPCGWLPRPVPWLRAAHQPHTPCPQQAQWQQQQRGVATMRPRRVRRNKVQKGRVRYSINKSSYVSFGDYGLVSLAPERITAAHVEAIRIVLRRSLRQYGGKLWIRVFTDIPVTKKPAETRMGKGKGGVDYWCTRVRYGTVLFEVAGVPDFVAKACLTQAGHKLGWPTKVVKRPSDPSLSPVLISD